VCACDGQELLVGHGGCDFPPLAPNGMAWRLCGTLGRSKKYRSQCVQAACHGVLLGCGLQCEPAKVGRS